VSVDVSQTGVLPEQSVEVRHSTQVFWVEQRGVLAGQSESIVQGGAGGAASTGGALAHS